MTANLIPQFLKMIKIKMILMVLVTIFWGYLLGAGFTSINIIILLSTLVGSGLVAAGSFVFNQIIEAKTDAEMERTKHRPLPSGKITKMTAFLFGMASLLLGLSLLYIIVNPLTALLNAFVAFTYSLVYTPLKQLSWLNTSIGAIPGAVPPLIGWAAATGGLSAGAWVLFLVLFLWQHPHFFAIGWIYRQDYRDAKIKILPTVEEHGIHTAFQTVLFAFLLLPAPLILTYLGLTKAFYTYGVLFISIMFLYFSIHFATFRSLASARKLLFASLIYLPLFLGLLSLDIYLSKSEPFPLLTSILGPLKFN